MVKVIEQQDLEPAIEEVQNRFRRPVTSACQYYTLYYLVEIADVDEIGFELMRTASSLRDAFYNYSVYATASEAHNVRKHFTWDAFQLDHISGRRQHRVKGRQKMTEEEMEERIEEKERVAGEFSQALRTQADGWPHDILKELMLTSRRLQKPPRQAKDEYGWAKKIEERYNAWTDSDSWFEAMKILFDTNWEQTYGDDRSGKQYGWNTSFGGDAWARVVDTAQLKDEMGKQAYVDLMWSVEHNNGNFIDKIELNVSKEREIINKALDNMDDFSHATPELGQDIDSRYFYDNLIPGFLTAVREENLRLAFEIAKETINEVNLHRYRHHIPDSDLEDEPTPKMGPQ